MVDTVALSLMVEPGMICRPDLFSTNISVLYKEPIKSSPMLFRAYNNPTRADKSSGQYKPKVTYFSPKMPVGRKHLLKVEFSAPKLLFGNNFDELVEEDFFKVVEVLSEQLKTMGVNISSTKLSQASVSAIHYSKNIPLADYTTVSMITRELRKISLPSRIDLSELEYRNGGTLLRCHANTFEVVFYDKIRDLRQAKISEKRTVEKDNSYQANLVNSLVTVDPFEVIRMEVRLNKKNKLKSILKKSGFDDSRTLFRDLFKKEVAQKILLCFWGDLTKNLGYPMYDTNNPYDILSELKKITPTSRTAEYLKTLGLMWLINSGSDREAKMELELSGKRSAKWSVLRKKLDVFATSKIGVKYQMLQHIPNALNKFDPLKLAYFNIKF